MIIKITKETQKWLAKESGFVVFLSLDIEGSTNFKITYPNNWMFHFENFFEKVRWYYEKEFKLSNSVIFKENGDEIIIAFFPLNYDNLKEIMDVSLSSVQTIPPYRKILKDIHLDYKATLFCAGFSEPEPFAIYDTNENRSDKEQYNGYYSSDYKNHRMHRYIHLPSGDNKAQPSSCIINSIIEYDYIGPDIDIGFRISKYSQPNKLIVSDKIAYIYSNIFYDLYNFKIISNDKLKGVWNDNKYPIIEYSNNKDDIIDFDLLYQNVNTLVNQKEFLSKLKNDIKCS
ncbi:MAG TPA: hypothetical protein PLV94_13430 [Spirochaetota bacterium]|nr:hypothetical protein [Spirochaetota bacterium]